MQTADLGKRWELQRASDACNSKIEKERWGSVTAILKYERRESDHGYRDCMGGKVNSAQALFDAAIMYSHT
jgi:hypothetical protein